MFFGSPSNAKSKGRAYILLGEKWEKFGDVLSQKKGNFIMIRKLKYCQTWKIWPSPLSLSVYSTFKLLTLLSGLYSESCQTSKMECFEKIFNGYKTLNNFAKRSIVSVWQGNEYTCNFLGTKMYELLLAFSLEACAISKYILKIMTGKVNREREYLIYLDLDICAAIWT